MVPDKLVSEEQVSMADLAGIEAVRLACDFFPSGVEIAHRFVLNNAYASKDGSTFHHRPALTVYVKNSDDRATLTRVRGLLHLTRANGWY